MPTGLLIRDFFKDYRELRVTNSGSIAPSEIEKNAYRLSLTLEITHLDAPRYSNLKTLPENTHFGYCTLFRGSSVIETIPIKYPKFRVFDIINQGIWNYHQNTENVGLSDAGLAIALKYYLSETLPALNEEFSPGWLTRELVDDSAVGDFGLSWYTKILAVATDLGEAIPADDSLYRAYPVASPFPDIAKFKADVPCSFLWRLEAWYLVNPAIYIVDNPTDSGDATEGEDEYPIPDQGDGDGDGNEFPSPDPIPSGRDPRDFPSGATSSDWFPGAMARISYTRKAYEASCFPNTFPGEVEVAAPIAGNYSFEFIGAVNGCDGLATPGGLRLVTPNGARVDIAVLEEQQWGMATVDSVVYFEA